jgi:hypothetical protein
MKETLLLISFIVNLNSLFGQVPRFSNDTLYTTSGFKIYKGQELQFNKGTGKNGAFRFVKLSGQVSSSTTIFTDKKIIVHKVKNFAISSLGNAYITITSKIKFNDGSTLPITFDLVFDKAIESFPGLDSELIVPEEFKRRSSFSSADEIMKLYKLYQDSIISKEDFEKLKAKIIDKE